MTEKNPVERQFTQFTESVLNTINAMTSEEMTTLSRVIIENAMTGDQLSLQFILECEIDAIKQERIDRFASNLRSVLSEVKEHDLFSFDQQDDQKG